MDQSVLRVLACLTEGSFCLFLLFFYSQIQSSHIRKKNYNLNLRIDKTANIQQQTRVQSLPDELDKERETKEGRENWQSCICIH